MSFCYIYDITPLPPGKGFGDVNCEGTFPPVQIRAIIFFGGGGRGRGLHLVVQIGVQRWGWSCHTASAAPDFWFLHILPVILRLSALSIIVFSVLLTLSI